MLASGSADKTLKLWDITTQQCYHTFTHHSDKVQAIQFHGRDSSLLATGGFDKQVALLDCRTGLVENRYSVSSDLEVGS